MLSSFKGKAAEQDRNTPASGDELIGRTEQQHTRPSNRSRQDLKRR